MKYTIKYSSLLLNTMLDTIKRENRRTIDGEDIINFEKIIKQIAKENDIIFEFESINNGKEFLSEIEPYIYIIEEESDAKYTLLPWIEEEELEKNIRNTIFTDMSFVYDITKEVFRFKRSAHSVQKLKNIEREVNFSFLKTTKDNITFFEQQKSNEENKLQKIKKNLHIRG